MGKIKAEMHSCNPELIFHLLPDMQKQAQHHMFDNNVKIEGPSCQEDLRNYH